MKVRAVLFAIVFLASSGAASACCVVDLRLPENEVAELTAAAKQGDHAAMWRLFQHYQLTPDAWNHAYWGERLALLNDKRVLLNLADYYHSLGTPLLCKRAIELAEQHAALSSSKIERDASLDVVDYFASRCGREQRPNNSFKPTPLRGAA